jgi:predicted MFS family arabinose efflux permease
VYGLVADRLGGRFAIRALSLLQIVVVAAFAMSSNYILIGVLTLIIGSYPPGIVPMMLARIHEVLPNDHVGQHKSWSRATTTFAAFQALAGYTYSALFNSSGGNHRLLFAIGAVALVFVVVVDWVAPLFVRETDQKQNNG